MNRNNRRSSRYLSQKRYTLLTGATGLLGRYLMREMLLSGTRLAVLVRPTQRQQARERIEAILQMWESELEQRLPRPVLLTGDVCQPNLGLSDSQCEWVGNYCDSLIHSAAILKFHGSDRTQEPWRTNLGGTENVIATALACDIENFHYVSTAYKCGHREDTVFETEPVNPAPKFRNDYEHSKYEAEKRVRAAEGFATKTIYRPAVIVGDSETGYTSTYHGLFLYLRLMAMLVPQQTPNHEGVIETPIQLPYEGNEPRNLVPVDWVAKAICHLARTPQAHNQTYHLTPDHCTTAKEVIEHCCQYFNSRGVEFCGPEMKRDTDNEFASRLFESTDIYSSYETDDPIFDKSNLDRFAGHLRCPVIDKEMIFKFLDFGKHHQWGKKRPPKPVVARWIESHLTEIALAAQKTMSALRLNRTNKTFKIGLDINGPGGGQWQLTTINGDFQVTPGLPDESCPVLKLSDLQINDLLLEEAPSRPKADRPATINWSEPLETVMAPEDA